MDNLKKLYPFFFYIATLEFWIAFFAFDFAGRSVSILLLYGLYGPANHYGQSGRPYIENIFPPFPLWVKTIFFSLSIIYFYVLSKNTWREKKSHIAVSFFFFPVYYLFLVWTIPYFVFVRRFEPFYYIIFLYIPLIVWLIFAVPNKIIDYRKVVRCLMIILLSSFW